MKILIVLDNLESLISMFLILEVKEKGTKNHRGLLLDQTDLNYLFQKPLWSLSIYRGPGFDTRSGHILSFLLSLFQEGQLSVTGESMCTKYWLTA